MTNLTHKKFEEIENALINGEFFIEYQPIMQIDGEKCLGAEALIRWQREKEVIPPSDFIPLIENTPLSGMLTYWLIEHISQELGEWLRKQKNVFLSINIPPELLGRGGLLYVASKCEILDISHKIVLEVTERGIPDNLGLQGLLQAKERGFTICLDDVGISNANLLVYARANIDMIKLDSSLSAEILDPHWTEDKIGSLKAFTQTTNVMVVAEGVETEYQRDVYQKLGVKMAQGWFYAHPLSAEGFREFFHTLNSND